MSLKKTMESLLKKVNGVDTTLWTRISYLFSSWPENKEFKPAYTFCFESGHTAGEMLAKYGEVVVIIENMLEVAESQCWKAKLEGRINTAESNKAEEIIASISKDLRTTRQNLYNNPERITFMSKHIQARMRGLLSELDGHVY